jgi:hypothetical protein
MATAVGSFALALVIAASIGCDPQGRFVLALSRPESVSRCLHGSESPVCATKPVRRLTAEMREPCVSAFIHRGDDLHDKDEGLEANLFEQMLRNDRARKL